MSNTYPTQLPRVKVLSVKKHNTENKQMSNADPTIHPRVKVSSVIEERSNIVYKKEKIHCHSLEIFIFHDGQPYHDDDHKIVVYIENHFWAQALE